MKLFFPHAFKKALVLRRFSSQTNLGDPWVGMLLLSLICWRNPSLSIHKGLNLKGMGPRRLGGSKASVIGLWYEANKGVIKELTSYFEKHKEICMMKWSSLVEILLLHARLFDKVNFQTLGLTSMKSCEVIISSTSLWRGLREWMPPFFSLDDRIMLRLPARMTWVESSVREVAIEFHQSLLSCKRTPA